MRSAVLRIKSSRDTETHAAGQQAHASSRVHQPNIVHRCSLRHQPGDSQQGVFSLLTDKRINQLT